MVLDAPTPEVTVFIPYIEVQMEGRRSQRREYLRRSRTPKILEERFSVRTTGTETSTPSGL